MEMEKEMDMSPKDMKKVQDLHGELMSMAEKYDMSMEELLEKCCMPEEEGMESEGEEEMGSEEEGMGPKKGMDRAKIALIIGKMRPRA